MSEIQKKMGVTDFVSEIQCGKNTLILKSWVFVTQKGLHGFKFKMLKMTNWRQTILVKFYLRVYDS